MTRGKHIHTQRCEKRILSTHCEKHSPSNNRRTPRSYVRAKQCGAQRALTPFPRDNPELTIAAAWQFADEGKRTLVFCTQRDHVESYATRIVDLARRGFIAPLLADEGAIERAKSVGAEWLGAEHPAVRCLELGVAIHHARLPNPFLREVERLLNEGVLTVTIASPTLAQGLMSRCP